MYVSRPDSDNLITCWLIRLSVAFKVYDMDRDGYISNGELYLVLKQMVGNNLKVRHRRLSKMSHGLIICVQDQQLQQIVDKTIMEADKDGWVSRWLAKIVFWQHFYLGMESSLLRSSHKWSPVQILWSMSFSKSPHFYVYEPYWLNLH